MKRLPATEQSLLLRTDFSNEAAWTALCAEVSAPVGDFHALVTPLSDRAWADACVEALVAATDPDDRAFLFVADRTAITGPDHAILVIDIVDEPGRTFRVIPHEAWSVENNLLLANMEFAEFAEAVDDAGVFRGFKNG